MNEELSKDELAYHQQVVRGLENAQLVLNVWGGHLRQKYNLGPQDTVTPEGKVVRFKEPEKNNP